jgi:hypothetical protein
MRLRPRYRNRPKFTQPFIPHAGTEGIPASVGKALSALWLPLLILVLPVVFYWPALFSGFHSDDFFYHAQFTYSLRDFWEKLALIHGGYLEYPFFRPVTILSFRLDYMIWGDDPVGFHLTNILLHALNCLLLFILAQKLGFHRTASAAASLLFGLYASHSEAVTWITGRLDVLSLTWILVSLLLWCEGRVRNDDRWLVGSLATYFIAIFAKEVAASEIFLLPLVDWLLHLQTRRDRGQGIGLHWRWYIVFLAVFLSVLGFRYWLYGDIGGYRNATGSALYFGTGLQTLMENIFEKDIWMMLTPISRVIRADMSVSEQVLCLAVGALVAIGFLAVLIRAILVCIRTDETPLIRLVFATLWIFILILPSAPIAGVARDLEYSRFDYAATLGLALWFGELIGFGMIAGRIGKGLSIALLILVLVISGVALRRQNDLWIEAGGIAANINAVMVVHTSDLPDGSTIYPVNFPYIHKGVHCAPGDYQYYLEFLYGKRNFVSKRVTKEPGEVDEWWDSLPQSWRSTGIGFVWDAEKQTVRVLPRIAAESEANQESEITAETEGGNSLSENPGEVTVFPEPPE